MRYRGSGIRFQSECRSRTGQSRSETQPPAQTPPAIKAQSSTTSANRKKVRIRCAHGTNGPSKYINHKMGSRVLTITRCPWQCYSLNFSTIVVFRPFLIIVDKHRIMPFQTKPLIGSECIGTLLEEHSNTEYCCISMPCHQKKVISENNKSQQELE